VEDNDNFDCNYLNNETLLVLPIAESYDTRIYRVSRLKVIERPVLRPNN